MLSKCWARSRPAKISKCLVEAGDSPPTCSSTQLLANLADLVIDFLVIGFEEHPLSLLPALLN